MASLGKYCWALFVLCSLLYCAFPTCNGQNIVNSDSLRHLEYDVVDQEQENASDVVQEGELTVDDIKYGKKMYEEAPASGINDQLEMGTMPFEEAKELLVTRKKGPCVGCPTDVDIQNPENLKSIYKLLEEPLSIMDTYSQNQYKFTMPNILSVTKQVESAIRYIITFETHRSLCLNDKAEKRTREECPPQPEDEGQICVVEVIYTSKGTIHSAYNNCTDPENTMSWKLNKTVYHIDSPDSESMRSAQTMEVMPSNNEEHLRYISTKDRHGNSQGTEDSQEADEIRMSRSSNVGALKDVDKSEFDLIAQFAELAVKTLDEIDPDNKKRIVLGVKEAKKQILNGVMYHLVLLVGTSTCRENEGSNGDSTICVENQLYSEKICHVQIHRSWADESPLNAKVVKSECADVWSSDIPNEPLPVERTRRSSQENWPTNDGWKLYELKDRSQGDCLDKVMTSFQEVLNVTDVKKVATIRDAHTRVNQETRHPEMVVTILLTDPEKLKMMGNVKKPMVVSSRVVCSQRLKRSAGIPGGLSDADVNDPRVVEITNFAMSEIQKSVNSPYRHTLIRIIEAKSQVVAGTLYHFKLEVAPTACLKSDQSASQSCTSTNSEQLLICTLKVWDQPWTQLRQVQDLNCGTSRSKREVLLGGPQHIDVEDPYVKELADFALLEIEKGLNSPYQQKVVRVVEAKRQVVAGTLMHLKLELATTNCLKREKVASENCVFTSDQDTTMCSLKVWDREWLKKRELQDLQCGRTRAKRETPGKPHIVGGLQPVDVDDSYVKELAAFALSEMDRETESAYQRKVIRITEARKQLVAGTLMHLKLELGLTSCVKGQMDAKNCMLSNEEKEVCSVKVWDQPWLNKKEVQDVQCGNSRSRRTASNNKEMFMAVDVNDPYIIESANFALGELDKGTNSPYRHKLVHVLLAQMEHSMHTNVKLNLEVGYSTCKKSSVLNDCSLLEGSGRKMCYVEIRHLPWQSNARYVTHLQCTPSNSGSHVNIPHNDPLIGGDDVDVTASRFRDFMHRFNKKYSSDAELRKRFRIFKANLKAIEQLQAGEQGTAQYGPTIFADLSPEEFKGKYLGLRRDLHQENAIPMRMADIPDIMLPSSFDWRDHNAVTPVKNQGACGSCWAFAVTGNLEGQYAINHGKLLSLSEQELVDCDTLDDGCKGGLPENAYHALEQLGGIETESDYPYGGVDEQCHFNRSEVKVQVKSSVNVTTNESDMAKWLTKNGPIAIGINANAMQFYVGGVSHPFEFLCSPGNLDHGVLIVGYGVHTTSIRHKVLPYWLIKNSWGTFWGEKGYYRVYRGDGTCGVNQMASSAVVA